MQLRPLVSALAASLCLPGAAFLARTPPPSRRLCGAAPARLAARGGQEEDGNKRWYGFGPAPAPVTKEQPIISSFPASDGVSTRDADIVVDGLEVVDLQSSNTDVPSSTTPAYTHGFYAGSNAASTPAERPPAPTAADSLSALIDDTTRSTMVDETIELEARMESLRAKNRLLDAASLKGG